jgi:hypothetical protein
MKEVGKKAVRLYVVERAVLVRSASSSFTRGNKPPASCVDLDIFETLHLNQERSALG